MKAETIKDKSQEKIISNKNMGAIKNKSNYFFVKSNISFLSMTNPDDY